MLPGWTHPRPTRKNYDTFAAKLCAGLSPLAEKGVSLILHGSYINGTYTPGRSDIDGLLIFPDDFVIDRTNLDLATTALADAMTDNAVPFQVVIADIASLLDGRFTGYNPTFNEYFRKEGRVMVGPDYRATFSFSLSGKSGQNEASHSLRKIRQGMLFSDYDSQTDYEQFLKRFCKALDATATLTKSVFLMTDSRVRVGKFSLVDELHETFPELDTTPWEMVKDLYTNPEKLDRLFARPQDTKTVWHDARMFSESLVKAYCGKHPR